MILSDCTFVTFKLHAPLKAIEPSRLPSGTEKQLQVQPVNQDIPAEIRSDLVQSKDDGINVLDNIAASPPPTLDPSAATISIPSAPQIENAVDEAAARG